MRSWFENKSELENCDFTWLTTASCIESLSAQYGGTRDESESLRLFVIPRHELWCSKGSSCGKTIQPRLHRVWSFCTFSFCTCWVVQSTLAFAPNLFVVDCIRICNVICALFIVIDSARFNEPGIQKKFECTGACSFDTREKNYSRDVFLWCSVVLSNKYLESV